MKKSIKRLFIIINIFIVIFMVSSFSLHIFQKLDAIIFDNNLKQTASHSADPHIIVITIDDPSIEELGQFPWDRTVYASLLDTINAPGYEPKAIAFDILFTDPSNEESDAIFAQSLASHSNIIFPVFGNTEGEVFSTSHVSKESYIAPSPIYYPYELFTEHVQLAHINRVNSHDGIIRQVWLNIQDENGQPIPSLAYKAAQMADVDLSKYKNWTDPKKTSDPISKGTMTIDYNLVMDDFLSISFIDVLYGNVPPENFKDAIVFIGMTATGLSGEDGQDSGTTPIERNARLVYVHANIANQLIEGSTVKFASNMLEIILIILVSGIFMFLPWRFKNLYTFIMVGLSIALLYGLQFWLFKQFNYQLSIVYIVTALLLVFIFNVSLKSYQEQQQKNFVTRQFGRYISPDLVKNIVEQGIDIQLGGISKRITVLFLDIRGFTSLSEKLSPAEIVDILNIKFTMITNTALKYNGTIDKFIGDAAMILFNAPLDVEDHERMAVLTAYHIQQNLTPIRQQLIDKYNVEVAIGIGIHTGNVVIGNIGSYLRMDYTAIGDTVNTASRIESGTKAGQILVSEEVYKATKHSFNFEKGEEKLFKGKTQPIQIYELVGIKDSIIEEN